VAQTNASALRERSNSTERQGRPYLASRAGGDTEKDSKGNGSGGDRADVSDKAGLRGNNSNPWFQEVP
jgi:hypothetical protein